MRAGLYLFIHAKIKRIFKYNVKVDDIEHRKFNPNEISKYLRMFLYLYDIMYMI